MFAHPDRALPLEIWSHIFAYLDCPSLARLSRVCRFLFFATIDDIWQETKLSGLLALLPGSYGRAVDKLVTDISIEDYCARFAFYAPHVKILNVKSGYGPWTPSRGFMKYRANYIADHIRLSNLEGLNLNAHYSRLYTSRRDYQESSILWMTYMIPPTLKDLSFVAGNHQDFPLLGKLFTMSPQLTRLKFNIDQVPDQDSWGWVSTYPIAQELTSLDIRCAEVREDGYLWLSRLPNLRDLKLNLGGQSLGLNKLFCDRFVTYFCGFSALRSLYISVSREKELQNIMQIWRMIAKHVTDITIEIWSRICTLDMFNQLFSCLVTSCPKTTFFHLHECLPSSTKNDARLPVSYLSMLRKLPFKNLRINHPLASDDHSATMRLIETFFPELEELWLENTTININDLLQVTQCFPSIRYSRLCFYALKPTLEPLNTTIGRICQIFDGRYRPNSSLALELHQSKGGSGWYVPYDSNDWDFAISLLVAHWSTVSIIKSNDELVTRHLFKLDEKIAFHSAQRDRIKL